LSGTDDVSFGSGNYSWEENETVGDRLYLSFPSFTSNDLYAYNSGTSGYRVKILNPAKLGDKISDLTAFKDRLYFAGSDGNSNGVQLWRTEGSSGNTQEVLNLGSNANVGNIMALDTVLLFRATTGSAGSELWISDGEGSGTNLLKDINPGSASSGISNMIQFGNKAYFTATESTVGNEIWTTDGTANGTMLFKEIIPGQFGSFASNFIATSKHFYFLVNDSIHGKELWVSDGTANGTKLLKDIYPGDASSDVSDMTVVR